MAPVADRPLAFPPCPTQVEAGEGPGPEYDHDADSEEELDAVGAITISQPAATPAQPVVNVCAHARHHHDHHALDSSR
jgi:hypothetical protein